MNNKYFLNLFWNQVDDFVCLGKQHPISDEMRKEWVVAKQLSLVNFPDSLEFKQELKNKLIQQANMIDEKNLQSDSTQKKLTQQGFMFPVWAFSVFVIIVMIFTTVFSINQPASASVNRSLGYGFLPDYGFFRLSNATVLEGPFRIENDQYFLEVNQGISQESGTNLWIKTNLDNAGGPLSFVIDFDNTFHEGNIISSDGFGSYLVRFKQQFNQEDQPVLVVNSEFNTAIHWIKSQLAGLAPTTVILSTPNQVSDEDKNHPCSITIKNIKICVEAAFRNQQGLYIHLLINSDQFEDNTTWIESSLRQIVIMDEFQRNYQAASVKCESISCNRVTILFTNISDLTNGYQLSFKNVFLQQDNEKVDLSEMEPILLKLPDRIPNFEPTPRIYPLPTPDAKPVPGPDD